jgi:uroporphyrinogen III methyltransferase/synthase
MNNEKTVRGKLSNIVSKVKAENIVTPAIIIIGNTASLKFVQERNKQLSNVKIGIIGTKAIRVKLEKGLLELGAKTYTLCDMHIEETSLVNELKDELFSLNEYKWIVFTSQNAIRIFFDKMQKEKIDRRKLYHIKFAVIGSGTKEALQKYGYVADFVPTKYTTSCLASELSMVINDDEKILIPRALKGSEELIDIFTENKIQYKEILIYDVKGSLTQNIEYISEMDCLIFVSASGVNSFFQEIHKNNIELPQDIKIACIGDVTVEAIKKTSMNVDIIASVSNTEGLIEGIAKFNWN